MTSLMLKSKTQNRHVFYNVQVRVREDFNTEMHIDTDDANACAIKTGDRVVILEK